MYQNRAAMLKKIEERRNTRCILFVTGDRPGMETQIHEETYDYFVNLLDDIGVTDKITLILYTRGGNTLAAWSIVNLIHQFCTTFELIVPSKAHSAGTLIALGAKTIVMTKQATLGPIDPSLNTPLNPTIDGAPPGTTLPVSVEAVNGFFDLCKENMSAPDSVSMKDLIIQLSDKIHPLVLGQIFRAKSQIQMLGKKLLLSTGLTEESINPIVSFLCSESGSHDYSIHRREAKKLGLPVEKPNDEFYSDIKAIYDDFADELILTERWNPMYDLGQDSQHSYSNKRCLLETCTGGCYYLISEGTFYRHTLPNNQIQYEDRRDYDGWKHEEPIK